MFKVLITKVTFLAAVFLPVLLNAQVEYNAFVSSPVINPVPLRPVEEGGTGIFTFNTGNTGTAAMTELRITVIITLSNGVAGTNNPLDAITGTAANLFSWTYKNGRFTGDQSKLIPANYTGTLIVSYKVTQNSAPANPLNGFTAVIRSGAYQNTPGDDSISLYTYTECAKPSAPVPGQITQPDCVTPTGSIVLNGLPEGNWTLNRNPGNIQVTGSGPTTTVAGLLPGTYSFTVTTGSGCTSDPLQNVVINQAPVQSPPQPASVVQPGCSVPTGSVTLNNLPAGTWTIITYPGAGTRTGTGTSTLISDLAPGTYSFAVRNEQGCTSERSSDVVINNPPSVMAPGIGPVIQPTCTVATGTVNLTGLPSQGTWTIFIYPGSGTRTGTGTTTTISELAPGTYNFAVRNEQGCTSATSSDVLISNPPAIQAPRIGNVTQPSCTTSSGTVSLSGLPSQGTWTILITPSGTRTGNGTTYTITDLQAGATYTFAVRSVDGCTSPASEPVTIINAPQPPAAPVPGTVTQPTCETSTGSVQLTGLPSTGTWTVSGTPGDISRTGNGTILNIQGLSAATYSFTVTFPAGCKSAPSANIIINSPPPTLPAPVPGTPVQPSCTTPTGSVIISGLPASGNWILTRNPGNVSTQGTGASVEITGLPPGNYNFSVASSDGCRSPLSSQVRIDDAPSVPSQPVIRIDCFLGASLAVVTITSPRGSGFEYRLDDGNFSDSPTFVGVRNGNHRITVRNRSGCTTSGDEFTVSCGCVNGPSISLSSRNGSTCASAPVTISGNTFGGNATIVTITDDGAGSITNTNVISSPFSFTYNPSSADIGKTVIITFTTNNPVGEPCVAAITTFALAVNAIPAAPVPGLIEHPTCTTSTGRVTLSGLPSQGSWILVRNPGNITSTGTGSSITVTGLESGNYTFSVITQGCASQQSAPVVINQQPAIPAAPLGGTIVHPGCTIATGSVTLTNLPAAGTWTLIQYPGTVTTTGTGESTTITGLVSGTYNFTVRSANGCTSSSSANIVINQQPPTPVAPTTGTITAPTCPQPAGSVVLSNLPASGNWVVNSVPAGITMSGRGTSATISGLVPGSYTFTVTNASGCISPGSAAVIIPQIPGAPVLVITNPSPVCFPATVNLTNPAIISGSTTSLTITYWMNAAGTSPVVNPASVSAGTYYIRGTNAAQCSDIKPVTVIVAQKPVADAGPDQELDFRFTTDIAANQLLPGESGRWSVLAGKGVINDPSLPRTTIRDLEPGKNILLWTVDNKACPTSSDTLSITVRDLVIPSLITPNEDGRNDYLILRGIEGIPGNELYIFDRRGTILFKSLDYKNDWNGIDYNGKPIPDGTYFYVFSSGNRRRWSGYIVIRR
ncbi:MAG TPA: gliding motility-associated C-terminal domain-containing protein [Bacteroidales bacterium]|nr:gliding motility-associated C-terminal domain-containing protein [Bacteroidales bacterium]